MNRARTLDLLYPLRWARWALRRVGYVVRPYDMLADRRRWFWQPRTRCGWPSVAAPNGQRLDHCGVCDLVPTTTGYVRGTQVGCPIHGVPAAGSRCRTCGDRRADDGTCPRRCA